MNTKSELLFESFLVHNNLRFEKIAEDSLPKPDYRVSCGDREIIFELKELAEDKNYGVVKDQTYPHIKSSSRTIGEHVRNRIHSSRKQIQYGAALGIPSVLLIYNNIDPVLQDFGTEEMDFIAAMYGAFTARIDLESRTIVDLYNGREKMLQESKNTSFSAIGHLSDRNGKTEITLYENVFAKEKINYDLLPVCFTVKRINVSNITQ